MLALPRLNPHQNQTISRPVPANAPSVDDPAAINLIPLSTQAITDRERRSRSPNYSAEAESDGAPEYQPVV
ncbi:hypothetical protein KCP75_13445 [Salmonella enterica subsp. enterica]|nr:hypothetical protein KCP75_13445 [Salmonella enterica subsp. enterica]